jgi:hypothetical protein
MHSILVRFCVVWFLVTSSYAMPPAALRPTGSALRADGLLVRRDARPMPDPLTLTSLSPASIGVGAPGLVLTVHGTGFLATAQIVFDGTPVPTTFMSETELVATVAGSLLPSNPTTRSVRVDSGSQSSNPLQFEIVDPIAASVTPNAALWGHRA